MQTFVAVLTKGSCSWTIAYTPIKVIAILERHPPLAFISDEYSFPGDLVLLFQVHLTDTSYWLPSIAIANQSADYCFGSSPDSAHFSNYYTLLVS